MLQLLRLAEHWLWVERMNLLNGDDVLADAAGKVGCFTCNVWLPLGSAVTVKGEEAWRQRFTWTPTTSMARRRTPSPGVKEGVLRLPCRARRVLLSVMPRHLDKPKFLLG